MGQKVNPKGFRVGVNKGWDSIWMADKKNIAANILEDNKIRKFLKKNYENCAISKVIIQRNASKLTIDIYTGKPGILIGQKGAGIEKVKAELKKLLNKEFVLNVNSTGLVVKRFIFSAKYLLFWSSSSKINDDETKAILLAYEPSNINAKALKRSIASVSKACLAPPRVPGNWTSILVVLSKIKICFYYLLFE